MIDTKAELLALAKEAAFQAGEEIMRIYASEDFSVESKADHSPLTLADRAAHEAITQKLEKAGAPILSEEGRSIPFEERKNWESFWVVDPLDGTKEFIKKNGEFTVNIAWMIKNRPILGVVYAPVTAEMYWAVKGQGAFKSRGKEVTSLKTSAKPLSTRNLKVVASRSHMNAETEAFVSQLAEPEIVSKGSSLKFLMVAEGQADLYPRFGPTMEWDTAAAQIIVEEAGGHVMLEDQQSILTYNKSSLLNPYFIVLPF